MPSSTRLGLPLSSGVDFHGAQAKSPPGQRFALQICRSLREYKKAVATDLRDGNNDWRTVAGTMDWGPDFSESLTDDDADEISDGSADGEL